eukprot:scaffold3609_cov65-Cyclotella_meneghiniana.AAC.7
MEDSINYFMEAKTCIMHRSTGRACGMEGKSGVSLRGEGSEERARRGTHTRLTRLTRITNEE